MDDALKITKVERVLCNRPGSQSEGTIHLTKHVMIFRFDADTSDEMWIPYPLISLVTRLPQTLHGLSPLAFRCRTFETFTLSFWKPSDAIDVFDSIRNSTVRASVYDLYAFYYIPSPPFTSLDGWNLYSPREEFRRMGIGERTKAWRFTDINKDYSFCPTYPSRLVIPAKISDATLIYAAKYRSKARVPALIYLHWNNLGSITRSSQPMIGLTNNRSVQDEKHIEAIFQSHHLSESPYASPDSRSRASGIYGATATNYIIDARPSTNAMANAAKGAGTENMDNYKEGKKIYLGVENIHVMRDSLAKVVDILREADSCQPLPGVEAFGEGQSVGTGVIDRHALRRSGWLKHISALLDGTLIIVRNVHVNASHVLIHCSDGWDRTSQLASLSQICLDPYYRTIRGLEILIEKDWVSFGHKFADRCGHLSSDKFFISPAPETGAGGAEAAQAFLVSFQNKIVGQSHLKETSPVFHQFLESLRQIQRQFPTRFEYNGAFLERIHYHLYSCQFGTFLYNSERERRAAQEEPLPPGCQRPHSLWDFLNSDGEREKYINPEFDPSLDQVREPGCDMGVLLPNSKDVKFWHELYGKTDEEMNGRVVAAPVIDPDPDISAFAEETDPIDQSLPPSPPPPSASLPAFKGESEQPDDVATELPAPPPSRYSHLTDSPMTISASLPNLDQKARSWQETFRPFASTASAFSLQSFSNRPPSPNTRRSTGEGLSAAGMRGVWAQLSSNATAALSVVQGAYDGIAKTSSSQTSDEGEMKTGAAPRVGDLDDWWTRNSSANTSSANTSRASEPRASRAAPGFFSPPTMTNPWATTKSPPNSILDMWESTPSGSRDHSVMLAASPPRPSSSMSTSLGRTSPFPTPPPGPHRRDSFPSQPRRSQTFSAPAMSPRAPTPDIPSKRPSSLSNISSNPAAVKPERSSTGGDKNIDPLGVGFL
ncbi:hypothetical protein BOTBODRAFT_167425 [Botryobasidium botryosum FD-172 SS1]|uniref:Myotubularin phosphatase domain-containing protein n=1 Tax=Botryobasidium botryosum (strain FD-172 SS1) TaxID=930990 RepID=A0A067LUQ5_BOTB1|nr:hypothetical protein BOTBODRAFT_167425 [Botryobasidium botryosum FD-172 SS1]